MANDHASDGDQPLSQAELETLLSAGSANAAPRRPAIAPATRPTSGKASAAAADATAHDRATILQLRSLWPPHEAFARRFGAALSTMLRTEVNVKPACVERVAFRELSGALETPTYALVFRAAPLPGGLLLAISPAILFPFLDRLLGGGGEPGPISPRPLTDIELRLAARISGVALDELRQAWADRVDADLVVERVESDRRAVTIVPASEDVVRIEFDVAMRSARGKLRLCMPAGALSQLAGDSAGTPAAAEGPQPNRTAGPHAVESPTGNVELVVRVAETRVAAADLLNLRAGDIIQTDQRVDSPLVVYVDGQPKFRACPGMVEGRKAVQIEGPIDPPIDRRR